MAPAFDKCDTDQLGYWNRDIEKAKAVLAESGAEGTEFELLVRNLPADIQMAQVIKQNAAEIDLTANISVVDEGTWVTRAWVDNPSIFEAMVTWYAGYSDPVMATLWWNPEKAGFTAGHMPMVPELNTLMDAAYAHPNGPEARRDAAGAMQQDRRGRGQGASRDPAGHRRLPQRQDQSQHRPHRGVCEHAARGGGIRTTLVAATH